LRYSVSCKHHHGAVSEFPFPSLQHAWRSAKLVPIGTVESGMRSTRIGNDFHVSHVEIGLIDLEIWLVVDSSSGQHFNRDDRVFIPSADPKDACLIEKGCLG
jgi:hypothetical protein